MALGYPPKKVGPQGNGMGTKPSFEGLEIPSPRLTISDNRPQTNPPFHAPFGFKRPCSGSPPPHAVSDFPIDNFPRTQVKKSKEESKVEIGYSAEHGDQAK